jgi:hypothetical protein
MEHYVPGLEVGILERIHQLLPPVGCFRCIYVITEPVTARLISPCARQQRDGDALLDAH